jgi:hypothetical protein
LNLPPGASQFGVKQGLVVVDKKGENLDENFRRKLVDVPLKFPV